ARLVLAISAMASGALIGIGPSGLAAIFGPEFSAAYPGVAIVAAGQLVASLFGSPEVLMAQANREALVARIMGLGVVANIVATALLIPPMGAMGAAVATASALILIRVLLWRACRRELGFSSAVIG
ncbi:MAG: polysaccharide biosynthesis C-terminal domain-containing protein, partial [Pseudomonadota bacterium]